MAATKIIYGKGRAPRPSEFSGDQLVINGDDAKVYSKDKTNNVFEVGGVGSSFSQAIFQGSFRSFIVRSSDTTTINLKRGTGIDFDRDENTGHIIISATGQTVATTASYVAAGDIDGNININSQTDLIGGNGLSLIGSTMTANVGNGLEIVNDSIKVRDIYLRNNANDESSGTITAANIHTNGIVKLAPQGDIAAVAGGIYYSDDNDFYLGFS